MAGNPRPDLIILGGGLAGGLAALALARRRPELSVLLVEQGERIGGNHLWSFFDADIDPRHRDLVDGLVAHRWPGYQVAFPRFERRLSQAYQTVESERLDAAVREAGIAVLQARAAAVTPQSVTLGDGRVIEAHALIDCRGLAGPPDGLDCGWQKFVGRLVAVAGGHGLDRPVVMDATVDQADGYRFVYCLPFDTERLFVEDTYYAQHPDLDRALLSERIDAYGTARGWRMTPAGREEQGVLPVVMGGDFDRFWPASDAVARGGVRAGLFHPLTSYSLPDAIRHAAWLSRVMPLGGEALGQASRMRGLRHWRRGRFDRMLARMLFRAAQPAERYRVLQRFYRLPAPLIARFYAGRLTTTDRVRILAGRPPVPIGRALRVIMEGV